MSACSSPEKGLTLIDDSVQVARLERSRVAVWQRLVAALLQTYGPGGDLEHLGGQQLTPLVQLTGVIGFCCYFPVSRVPEFSISALI